MVPTEFAALDLFTDVAKPVTTTSLIFDTSSCSIMVTLSVPLTVCDSNPMKETTSFGFVPETLMEKAPFPSVCTVLFVDLETTVAPAKGVPFASVTLPVTDVCANSTKGRNSPYRTSCNCFAIFLITRLISVKIKKVTGCF